MTTDGIGLLLGAALLGGCAHGPFGRVVDAFHPWPSYGSSQELLAASRVLAPNNGLTVRRVLHGPEVSLPEDRALEVVADEVWPAPPPRQNTLADFERVLHEGGAASVSVGPSP